MKNYYSWNLNKCLIRWERCKLSWEKQEKSFKAIATREGHDFFINLLVLMETHLEEHAMTVHVVEILPVNNTNIDPA